MRTLTGFALALALTAGSAQAATIYSEDFAGQQGKGAIGATLDTSGVTWTVDLGDAALFDANDYAAVDGNDRFVFQDTNAGCLTSGCTGERSDLISDLTLPMWLSPIIDISAWTNLSLSAAYGVIGNVEFDGGVGVEDDLIFSVLLDGTEIVLLDLIQTATNADDITGILNSLLSDASTLQIKVSGNTYAQSERLFFDTLVLSGDAVAPVPLPATLPLLLAAIGGMGYLRHRRS